MGYKEERTIFQQGTYAPNDLKYRWMGSIAMDQSGNMALGFSLSGSAIHPEIRYTGRLAGDAAGIMAQGEYTIINGAGSQSGSRGLTRWGDYSSMSVDPTDDCTFWYTTESCRIEPQIVIVWVTNHWRSVFIFFPRPRLCDKSSTRKRQPGISPLSSSGPALFS